MISSLYVIDNIACTSCGVIENPPDTLIVPKRYFETYSWCHYCGGLLTYFYHKYNGIATQGYVQEPLRVVKNKPNPDMIII